MDDYTFRHAKNGDREDIVELWQRIFGDSREFIDKFLSTMTTPGEVYVAEHNGKVVSMGFLLLGPKAKEYACAYIYAMATYEEHRGQGLASHIAQKLKSLAYLRGIDIVATLPANDGLINWYADRLQMCKVFKKGGEGVRFPPLWQSFSAYCGEHDPTTPDMLLACSKKMSVLCDVHGLGWECTFD